jgi:hypothetical protein
MLNYQRFAPAPDGTLTDRSATIAAGGTAQEAAPANAARVYLLIQNPGTAPGPIWFAAGAIAVAASPSIELAPGQAWESPASFCPTGAISVIAATTGATVTIKEA